MKIFGRGFPLSDADLFLSATISVDPRPIYRAGRLLSKAGLLCFARLAPMLYRPTRCARSGKARRVKGCYVCVSAQS